jgi:uncharacterized protein YjbI with pentapeptide repeats
MKAFLIVVFFQITIFNALGSQLTDTEIEKELAYLKIIKESLKFTCPKKGLEIIDDSLFKALVMTGEKNFVCTDLRNVNFDNLSRKIDWSNLNLSYSNLEGVSISNSYLNNINLTGANLNGIKVRTVKMKNASLGDSVVEGASFTRVSFKGAIIKNLQVNNSEFINVVFLDSYISDSHFEKSLFKPATFASATIEGTKFLQNDFGQTKMYSYKSQHKNRDRINAQFINIAPVNFENATLSRVLFYKGFMTAANFKSSNLDFVEFEDVNSESIIANGIKWTYGEVKNANFKNGNFQNATISDVDFAEANFRGANLENADFSELNFYKAQFDNAKLINTNLSKTSLGGASFKNSDLSHAIVTEANFISKSCGYFFNKFVCKEDSKILNVNLEGALNLSELYYDSTDINNVPNGVVPIRNTLRNNGFFGESKELTSFLKTGEFFGELEKISDKESTAEKIFYYILYLLKYLALDYTVDWGADPNNVLFNILPKVILLFFVFYSLILFHCYRKNPEYCKLLYVVKPSFDSDEKQKYVEGNYTRISLFQSMNKGYTPNCYQSTSSLPLSLSHIIFILKHAFWFSTLSAFHLGWRDLNVGNWLLRLQSQPFAYREHGVLRSLSGIQSLISLYLIAIWALTSFSSPWG